jgi:hypothetical protein
MGMSQEPNGKGNDAGMTFKSPIKKIPATGAGIYNQLRP